MWNARLLPGVLCGSVSLSGIEGVADKVWLQHADGEAGTFDAISAKAALDQGPEILERFFWENF